MQPYYEQSGVTIYLGDCRDVLPLLPRFDIAITSPPYNLGGEPWPHLGNWKPGDSAGGRSKWANGSDAGAGIQYGAHDDSMPWPEYVAFQHEALSLLWRGLSDAGVIFYNHKPRVIGAKLWTPLELIPAGVVLRQIVQWKRPGGMNYNPTAFVPMHEWVMVLARPAFRLKSKGVSGLGDVWEIAPEANPHPAPFPLGLPERALEACRPGLVVDPFMGSGTTLVAAQLRGLNAIGMDTDEACCEMAARRLGQGALPLTFGEPVSVAAVDPSGGSEGTPSTRDKSSDSALLLTAGAQE